MKREELKEKAYKALSEIATRRGYRGVRDVDEITDLLVEVQKEERDGLVRSIRIQMAALRLSANGQLCKANIDEYNRLRERAWELELMADFIEQRKDEEL